MSIYNPTIPQPPDIPQESQSPLLSNFQILNSTFAINHVPFSNIVSSAISNGSVTDITSQNHLLSNGATVVFETMKGFANDVTTLWSINGTPYVVTVIDENRFSVPYNSSAESPYLANSGSYYVTSSYPYGYHTKVSFASPLTDQTVPQAQNSIVYSKYRSDGVVADLFFKNGTTTSLEKLLTNTVLTPAANAGQGFVTPWGLIINFGTFTRTDDVPFGNGGVFSFPIPFTSPPQVLIVTGTNRGSVLDGVGQALAAATATTATINRGVSGSNYWYLAMGF